jgi:hypothetical protein
MSRPILAIILSSILGFVSSQCSSKRKDEVIPIGPEVKASLVIYFKKGVTEEQIKDFWQTILSKPDPRGGHLNRDGVRDILSVFTPVQGHEAVAVTFFPDASQEDRDKLKTDVRSSPIVYKVLENVSPAEVKKID